MKLLVLAALFASAYATHEQYIGWKFYYVGASTEEQVKKLNALGAKLKLDFLSPAHLQREAAILVQPEHQEEFTKNLDNLGIKFTTHADDVKLVLDHEDEIIKNRRRRLRSSRLMPYNNYQRLDMIYAYMTYTAAKYESVVNIFSGGPTPNERSIRYMKISSTNFEDTNKPVIFIEGGMHSKEWISTPVVTWAIKKLTDNVTEPDLLEYYDWILIPVVNPDGYEHSFTTDRFWRKTRSTNMHISTVTCLGVDINRNFDIFWDTASTTEDPCSKNFPGVQPFTEIETRMIRNILQEYRARIALYLSMHSFGSMILYPFGNNSTSSNNYSLHKVGVAMADAISKLALPNFPRYVVGNAASTLGYKTFGTSIDYAHSIGIPLAYAINLPGFPKPYPEGIKEGYKLDPKYIEQVCRETWAGIVVGARRAKQSLNNNKKQKQSKSYVEFKLALDFRK